MMNFNYLILINFILFSFNTLLAQDLGVTEVIVNEGFIPSVPNANRLNENAIFDDTIAKNRIQFFKVMDLDLGSNYQTKSLTVAKVREDKIYELYSTSLEGGFGSAYTTKFGVVHNSVRSKNLSFGLIANHFANKYSLAKNNSNSLSIYSKKVFPSCILLFDLAYERNVNAYFDDSVNKENDKFFRNRFAYTKFSFSAISNKISNNKLNHHTKLVISDLNEFSENQIHLSSNLNKIIDGVYYALSLEGNNFLRYTNSDSEFNKNDFKTFYFSPSTILNLHDIELDLGADLDFSNNSFGFYPKFKAAKELVKDILLVKLGFNHIRKIHTLKSLSDENPYIHSFGLNQTIFDENSFSQQLRVSNTQEFFLSMRNVLSKGEVFQISIAYGVVKDFAYFIRLDNDRYKRFKVMYFNENINQFRAKLDYSRIINELISINFSAHYFSWDQDVYFKPNFFASFSAPINLRNKIQIKPLLSYSGKRKVNDAAISYISSQIHANLEINYTYSKQLSAYLQLNNLSNSKQGIWFGYDEVGFNALIGLRFSF